ncbi:MAG: hypothetical protein COW71_04735 [Ignavibacteriales bacterium CG18_big_fil_WC_8_21_14_2_50_31_20]|nr:MAG: hypothetical protein COW71_04735 [Ignavibacteriales bacterium CG18_big_fil_WC_8_21_14_2_50_31_20]
MVKFKYLIILFYIIIFSCSDGINNPLLTSQNSLCYVKQMENYKWEVFTNNMSGSNPINISNHENNDENPVWSPNGKYILYKHSNNHGNRIANVYNLEKNTIISVTSDSGEVGIDGCKWLPNGKIFILYRTSYYDPYSVFIVNPDGSKKIKMRTLSFGARTYFYQDSYNFLYEIDSKVYKTNLDNSYEEYLFDLESERLTIRDFNPLTGILLLNTYTDARYGNSIVEYNIETKQSKIIVTAEKPFVVSQQRYSKDYTKVAFLETNTNGYDEHYLSIFENGAKKRIVKLVDNEWFDSNPMEFSHDGNYIAFAKNINVDADWISWKSELYIVDINTEKLYFIDEGHSPSWNLKN